MNDKPIHEMTFDEYYLFQLPTAQRYAPGQPESFYRRQARRNFENIQKSNEIGQNVNDGILREL